MLRTLGSWQRPQKSQIRITQSPYISVMDSEKTQLTMTNGKATPFSNPCMQNTSHPWVFSPLSQASFFPLHDTLLSCPIPDAISMDQVSP